MDIYPSIAFIGSTLGPLFLVDPEQGACSELFSAFANLDAKEAGEEWPFVDAEEATRLIAQMQQGLQGDPDDLLWEFRRLFAIGPTLKPAPPWGSYYTDHEGAICSEATLELRKWLRINGIGKAGEKEKVEDHIGQMLVLMSWIAENRPDLIQEYLSKHLLTWSQHFLKILQVSTKHPFYEGLASLTNASLCGIRDELNLQIVYPQFYR